MARPCALCGTNVKTGKSKQKNFKEIPMIVTTVLLITHNIIKLSLKKLYKIENHGSIHYSKEKKKK